MSTVGFEPGILALTASTPTTFAEMTDYEAVEASGQEDRAKQGRVIAWNGFYTG